MRIALVAPPWLPVPPPAYGGTERVVALLADGLVARGHDVTLFAAAGSRTAAQLESPLEHPSPFLGGEPDDDVVHQLSPFLERDRFDVIHDLTGLGPAFAGGDESSRGESPRATHGIRGAPRNE